MRWLERQWRHRSPAAVLLYPLAALFGVASGARRALYRRHVLRRERLPVPVVVVGNIAVGGTGKTPLVLWLCDWLRRHGHRPGILTRGYGGSLRGPARVPGDADPARYGDESVLLAVRSGCPVWIGRDRAAAGRALLAADADCDVLVCDDGLQHYTLDRDVEIAVVDATREHGNGWLLPAGPLREPVARLRSVDAVVLHGDARERRADGARSYRMSLTPGAFYNLLDHARYVGPDHFRGKRVHAVAGIGHPERFFRQLHELGLVFSAHPYPDHHAFRPEDLAYADAEAIVMTEKDAVKCQRFATERWWALPVDAEVDPALGALVLRKLESR